MSFDDRIYYTPQGLLVAAFGLISLRLSATLTANAKLGKGEKSQATGWTTSDEVWDLETQGLARETPAGVWLVG